MYSPYSYFLRYTLLERLFVIYNVSNLDHNHVAIFYPSRCTSSRLRDMVESCLLPLDPSPPNPHLTYLQFLMTYPVRFDDDIVAQAIPSPSFAINQSFFCHWTFDLKFFRKTSYLWHIVICQHLALIPIVITNRHPNTNCYFQHWHLRNLTIWSVLAKEKLL